MKKAIITFAITFIIGILFEVLIAPNFETPTLGIILTIAVAGACVVFFNDKKER